MKGFRPFQDHKHTECHIWTVEVDANMDLGGGGGAGGGGIEGA